MQPNALEEGGCAGESGVKFLKPLPARVLFIEEYLNNDCVPSTHFLYWPIALQKKEKKETIKLN